MATVDEKAPLVNGATNPSPTEHHSTMNPVANKEFITPTAGSLDFPWRKIGSFIDPMNPPAMDEIKVLNMESNNKTIENYIVEKYYSDLYWNCTLMIGTCFFAWFFARLGGGFFSLCFVLICSSAIYRTEFRRFNRNLRDDMTRIGASESLDDRIETMHWMNSFLAKFWVIYMPALSDMVITQATAILSEVDPPSPIDKLTLDEFTLGSKAPRIESIKSFSKLGKDVYQMDWDFGFAPNDTDDMTKNEIKKKIDPKVALGVRIGKGFVGASLPILVENMSFKGKMRITLKLGMNFPHINIVSVSFLDPPSIDYSLKPIGGDTFGLDIMSMIPSLASFVNSIIHSTLGPMLYAPNSFDVNVEEIIASTVPEAIGCLAVTVRGAEYTKSAGINPFVEFATDAEYTKPSKTDIKANTNAPVFNETKYILVQSLEQKLNFKLFDFKDGEPIELGVNSFEMSDLLQKEVRNEVEGKLTKKNKSVGRVIYDLKWFPVLEGEKLDDGTKEAAPVSEVGIFKMTLHSARNLDTEKSILGKLSPFAELHIGNELVSTSRVVKGSNEPDFKVTFEKLVMSKSQSPISIIIKDTSSYGTTTIGEYHSSSLNDLVFAGREGKDSINLTSGKGKLRVSASWKPLGTLGLGEAAPFIAPLGIIRLHIAKCENLKNLETIGSIDPYVRVLTAGRMRASTLVIEGTLNPIYNEVVYIPVISENQMINFDCMDVEKTRADRLIGSTPISLGKYIKKNEHNNYLAYEGSTKFISKPLVYKGKEQRGSISYSISFYPTIPVYSHKELQDKHKAKDVSQEEELEELNEQAKLLEEYKKKPELYEWYTEEEDQDVDPNKKEMTLQQLCSYNSGGLGINLVKGSVFKPNCYVQCLFDDRGYPDFVSLRAQGRKLGSSTGESFIRDLANSTMLIRITNRENVGSQSDIYSEREFKVMDLLTKGYERPTTVDIEGNSIQFQFEYVPTAIPLGLSESITDTGILDLTIVKGSGLKAADRNGKSDPYCKIFVNGVEVHRTEKVKKTLDPVFNEQCTFPVPSRSRSEVKVDVYDWDMTGDDDLLGSASLDLTVLKPGEQTSREIKLDTQGSLFFSGLFQPKYIRPKVGAKAGNAFDVLKGSRAKIVGGTAQLAGGTIGATGAIAGGAVGAVGAVGGAVGGGLMKGLKFGNGRKSIDANRDRLDPPTANNYGSDMQSMRSNRVASSTSSSPMKAFGGNHKRQSSDMTSFASTSVGENAIPGRLTVVGCNGIVNKDNYLVKVVLCSNSKQKDLYKTKASKSTSEGTCSWRESIPFKASSDSKLVFYLKSHHTFGKSADVSECEITLSEVSGNSEDVSIPLNTGEGELVVNFNYSSNN